MPQLSSPVCAHHPALVLAHLPLQLCCMQELQLALPHCRVHGFKEEDEIRGP